MELISAERRAELLFGQPAQEIRKLEIHDHYGVDQALFDAWRSGDHETVTKTMAAHRNDSRQREANGFAYRRVRIVSEPLSEYQRMAIEIANPDEQLRWLPRSKVSALPLPGNDCLIRNDLVLFILLDGANQQAGTQLSTDPAVIEFCNDAFEKAWSLGTPNGDYTAP
ncbi:DUF6879 family protein [Nocardioides sp. YJ-D4]